MAAIWPIAFELWDKRVRSVGPTSFLCTAALSGKCWPCFLANGGLNVVRNVVRNGKLFRINHWVMENIWQASVQPLNFIHNSHKNADADKQSASFQGYHLSPQERKISPATRQTPFNTN
ncbi:GM18021 [Drosophila sechellia]|uniref:GM18021 n=1 Tax=Drosophila sechellia TaxID=7238 RepID=B4I1G1_DROSE|nr:GM18021 [Drosophila sechellia]